jgi:hypothetical protein
VHYIIIEEKEEEGKEKQNKNQSIKIISECVYDVECN